MPLFFRRTAAQKSWLRALEALLCKVFQGIPFHWMRGRVPRSSPPASGHLRTACKGSIDKEGPLPWQRPLFVYRTLASCAKMAGCGRGAPWDTAPHPMEWDALEHLAEQGFQGAKPRLLCRCAAEKQRHLSPL